MKLFYLKLMITLVTLAALPWPWAAAQQTSSSAATPPTATRFDHLVRNDFFAGYAGDHAALQRGMAKCEAKLAVEPEHAEALVWHGGGLLFQSSSYFAKQDFKTGMEFYERGLAEMEKAVRLEPKNVSILVPRAALLLTYSRFIPDPQERQKMLGKVISDYEEVYRQQQPYFARLSGHARGELLMGLAEAYLRTGQAAQRNQAHALLKQALAENDYATEAKTWLQAPPEAPAKTFAHKCIGCHS